jgi:hypothetical protein
MLSLISPIRQKARWQGVVGWLGVALALAVFLCLMSPSPVSAEDDLAQSFQFSYDPVSFDKSEIQGSEVFHATIAGRVTCVKDLPMSASEATLTSRVVAVHAASGTELTLNSSYTITIKPFPAKKDETAEIKQAVPLQFPAQAEAGDYNVIGKIVEAKVKVVFIWVDVTGSLPQDQTLGTVKYTVAEPTPIPENPPSSQPLPVPPPLKSTPSGADIPTPQELSSPSLPPPHQSSIIPWWVWLVVLIAAITTLINIVSLVRRRAG